MTITPETLEEIQRDNRSRLARIQAQGVNLQIPQAPTMLVEKLVEAVIGPQGSPEWVAFVHAYEMRFRAMLDDVESQISRVKLTAPGPAPNGVPQGILKGLP